MHTLRRSILAIALPAIASNITTPLLGLVDSAITGHIGSAVYLGAIAVGGTVFNMLYWVLNFLRMGSGGLTAQAHGHRDHHTARVVLWRGLLLASLLGVLIIALSGVIGPLAVDLVDTDGVTGALALRYFSIVVWGAPAVLCTYVLTGWFLGMQNTRATMWMALFTNLLNIAVSVVLVFGLHWKIAGVATGTLVAQWAGLGFGLLVLRRYNARPVGLRTLLHSGGLKRYFSINADIMLRTICLVIVTTWFTRSGSRLGVDTLAANALLMQLFMLFSYFMDGFAYAGEALGGSMYAAGTRRSVERLSASLLRIGITMASVFTIVYIVGGHLILRLLTDQPDVVACAVTYLPWAAAVPMCGVWAFVWDGIFIGLTRTRAMLGAMLVAMTVFFGTWLCTLSMGNHGLWLAFCLYLLARGACEWATFRYSPYFD
ncbi:MAG: MATE family efflux transporter [Muribaculaceae bacterium]|nr:MATE family efflux transporter [Muribaculaceae bacterium]